MFVPATGRGQSHLVTVHIPVQPVPCPRPRVTKRGFTYYPKSYNDYKDDARPHVPPMDVVWDNPLAAHFEFVLARPKTTKFSYPVRGDIDNFVKTACDLLTSVDGYWEDDRQVVAMTAIKRWTKPKEEPHTLIEIHGYEPRN